MCSDVVTRLGGTATPALDGRADVDSDDGVHGYNVVRCVAMLPLRM